MEDTNNRGSVPGFPRPRDLREEADDGPERPHLPATWFLIAVFGVMLVVEYVHSLAFFPQHEAPALETLLLLGAGAKPLVFEYGQYFRLLTLGFLHGGLMHFAMNALCLFALGRQMEPRLGAIWFIALFMLGTIGASLVSMVWNGPEVVAVGASGGIMALAAFLGVSALRMAEGYERRAAIALVRGLVIATLIVGFTAGLVLRFDNAAHVGGLIAGGILGVLMVPFWRDTEYLPGGCWLAVLILCAGFALMLHGITTMLGSA